MRHQSLRGLAIAAALVLASCGGSDRPKPADAGPPTIGLLLDTLAHERWQRDRDLFTARAKELGVEVHARDGGGTHAGQVEAANALLNEGVKVLVLVPNDLEKAGEIVTAAAAKQVPVISYDRLIRNADLALYVSFDNVKVGRMQADYLLQRAPKGNYVLLGGAPTDYNAELVRQGQMEILEPAVKSGAIRIVADPMIDNWDEKIARETLAGILKKTRNIVAVVASNDAIAGGAVEALAEAKLAGKVLVSGQDADLPACQRLVTGTQAMTVYKPLSPLARMAAGSAVGLVRGQTIDSLVKVDNGFEEVPARLMDPIWVDKGNVDLTVIADNFHSREQVYGGTQ